MITLNEIEQRVLGALIEKELSTPEYYPLTLNALTAACNQKSNRDPVLTLEDRQVRGSVEALIAKDLAWQRFSPGSRAAKYAHKFSDTLSKAIEFNKLELAILAELLLRGPQTVGELRGRASRMAPLTSVEDVERVLRQLSNRGDGPYVAELPRYPGQRDARFTHLFGGGAVAVLPLPGESPRAPTMAGSTPVASDRIVALEQDLYTLKQEVAELRSHVQTLLDSPKR